MRNHSYVKLWRNLGIAPGKLEESGKILGKDLWVMGPLKRYPVERFKREIAPVQLNGLNKVRPRNSLNGSWMKRQAFWDIFSTPEQLNNENWMIKRCTGMRKHLKQGKIWSTKLELNPPEKKRMKNDEHEAPLVSSWEPPDKNIDGKEWSDLPSIKGYSVKKSKWLKKRWEGGKTKMTWDGWNKHCWENLELI